MTEFTFLTEEQCFDSDKKLEILEKRGTIAPITDFSILLGGRFDSWYHYNNSDLLEDSAGLYWTSSDDKDDHIRVVSHDGDRNDYIVNGSTGGARPAIPYSSIRNISSNGVRGRDGILEVEYGEYPQKVVSKRLQKELESRYNSLSFIMENLTKTGKTYTTDSRKYNEYNKKFEPQTIKEYLYSDGKKYVRVKVNSYYDGSEFKLSNGERYKNGDYVWVEVEPIKWLIDEKSGIALSERILFAGVQFNHERNYKGDFDKTDIKEFMDKYFSKDIMPSLSKEIIPKEENEPKEENRRENPYGFNFENVSEEDIIKGAIESGVAVFLHGKSSEGKSARVKQIDPNAVIIYLRNATPESLNGKSVYNSKTGEMIDVKPTWLKKLEERCTSEPDKYHIVFLDEITNALPSIQGIAFNIVLDREVNGMWKLPENARIVAAGNEMKDSLAANQLAEPLFNRFAHVYIETSVDSWLKWASEHNIHPAIYAYIAYKKGEALRSKYDGEKPNADPRKWEMASKMLYATGKPEMLRALVGEEITREFCEFCNQRVITLEDVINDNYTDRDLQMNTALIYATAMGLSQVDEANYEKVREFVLRLGGEPCAIFDSLWTHGDEARMEIVAEAKLKQTGRGRSIK